MRLWVVVRGEASSSTSHQRNRLVFQKKIKDCDFTKLTDQKLESYG